MINQRLGNDIKVFWSIKRKDGNAFSLEGSNVSLYLRSAYERTQLNDFAVSGNVIEWTYYGKDQKGSGKYSLEMVVNEGETGMMTTDVCNFVNLVSCSCKLAEGKDEDGVETQTILLESTANIIEVDSELSDESTNPVENRAVTNALNSKADRAQITELSKEIGKKVDAEKVATINGKSIVNGGDVTIEGGESSVFEAIYGQTSYAEIVEAVKTKKHVLCFYNGKIYNLYNYQEGADLFFTAAAYSIYLVYCTRKNVWSISQYDYEVISNKTTTITDSSTDSQYPSAKAVYNAIKSIGGGGEGGSSYDDTELRTAIADLESSDAEQTAKLTELYQELEALKARIAAIEVTKNQ